MGTGGGCMHLHYWGQKSFMNSSGVFSGLTQPKSDSQGSRLTKQTSHSCEPSLSSGAAGVTSAGSAGRNLELGCTFAAMQRDVILEVAGLTSTMNTIARSGWITLYWECRRKVLLLEVPFSLVTWS